VPFSCLVMLAPIGPTGSIPANANDAREVVAAQLLQYLELTDWAMRMMPRHHPHSDVVFVSLPSSLDADGHDHCFSGLTRVTQTFRLELGDGPLRIHAFHVADPMYQAAHPGQVRPWIRQGSPASRPPLTPEQVGAVIANALMHEIDSSRSGLSSEMTVANERTS
jgi:hypothetical protein